MSQLNENVVLEPQVDNIVNDVPIQEPETTPEAEPEMIAGVVDNCTKLNVRTEPVAIADVVCRIPCGTEVMVSEEESTDEFYKVYTATGIEGYCMKKYITINP